MPHRPPPAQLSLRLDDPSNRPPAAPSTPELLEALADLLLAAMAWKDRANATGGIGDEPEDRS